MSSAGRGVRKRTDGHCGGPSLRLEDPYGSPEGARAYAAGS